MMNSHDHSVTLPFMLLQRCFPIVTMTPEEVSRHLPSHASLGHQPWPLFDVVIFDEASQLPSTQALTCIGRARHCIVVGDDQQLPPRDGSRGLLDDCLDIGMPVLPLEWHYRSGHQSLIQVSNELFYFGKLQTFPSAHSLRSSRRCARPSHSEAETGLLRVPTAGVMQSNADRHSAIESFAREAVSRQLRKLGNHGDGDVASVRYPAYPQGYIHPFQARAVLEDVCAYIRAVQAQGAPMSLGVITLNRPQRQLIFTLVDALKAVLGLHLAPDGCFVRVSESAHAQDQPFFIQSIDQIQGEERDVILFSTLIAPKHESKKQQDELEAKFATGSGEGHEGAALDEALEDLEVLEEDPQQATATPSKPPTQAQRADPTPSRISFSYSTLTHPHGDRLLNVGLTRAIRLMKCYYHPKMAAPSAHDPKAVRSNVLKRGGLCS